MFWRWSVSNVSTLTDKATRELISELVKFFTFGTYVEVGVYLGGNIIPLAKENENNAQFQFYAVDNFEFVNISSAGKQIDGLVEKQSYLEDFRKNVEDNQVKNIITVQNDSIAATEIFANNSIDVLFLDGNHTYPYVKEELEAWIQKLKASGVIIGHDYCGADGIKQAVREVFNKDWNQVLFVPDYSSYIACKVNSSAISNKLLELKEQGKLVC